MTEHCHVYAQLVLIIYSGLNDVIHHKSLLVGLQLLLQSSEYLNTQIRFLLKLKKKMRKGFRKSPVSTRHKSSLLPVALYCENVGTTILMHAFIIKAIATDDLKYHMLRIIPHN